MTKEQKIDRRHYLRLKAALKHFGVTSHFNKDILKSLRNKAGFKTSRREQHKLKNQKKAYKQKYHEYLKSDEWTQIKIEMLTMFPFCQRCGSKYSLQVHHKTYKNVFHEEPEDLEVLCRKCHKEEHGIK